ncbi:MAG TPA: S-layer homology domain-containing protein [Clostridiaceae bacterium]|nr:S-layer homology domain-containing protein [Clostridiaceae bacterium]
MKKFLCCILTISIMLSVFVLPANKVFADSASEVRSMQRLMDLGIFAKTDTDKMNLSDPVTREQLAVVLVHINGLKDKLDLYENTSLFTDVPVSRWSNPYINVAVRSGYMNAKSGNIFSPTEKVTFSTVAEILGKMLKYDDAYLPGSTNEKYLRKLDGLGILDTIDYSPNAFVTRGQIALMLDRLLSTKVFGTGKNFIDTVSAYKSAIVLENSIINKNVDDRQILTDKGFFYLKDGIDVPDAGKQYYFSFKDNDIQHVALTDYQYKEYSVSSFSSGILTTNNGEKVKLPAGIPYYYKGSTINYSELSSHLEMNSSVIIAYDGDKTVYGTVFNPIKSDPEVITSSMAGVPLEIKYKGHLIDKGGKYISASQIEINDVVYKVTDIWNQNPYIIVYDNMVSGKITAILPNKISPVSIEIDNKPFTLGENFPKEKLNRAEATQVGETAKLIIGADGTAVDIITETIPGTNRFVFVLNAYTENSVKSEDFGTPYYYVTLLHSDGGKKTYRTQRSMSTFRGRLATYEIIATGKDYDTVKLVSIDTKITGSYKVDKDERMIGDSYVANGAVLFNIINTASAEIEAEVISFSDLPAGYLMSGRVKYIHRSGDFMDIDVMLLDDALEDNVAYGLVTSKKTDVIMAVDEIITIETVTLLVNGQTMVYTGEETGLYVNSVARVKLDGNKIRSVQNSINASEYGKEIQAVDSSRIRINGKVYTYHKNIAVYEYIGPSRWKTLKVSDLKKGTEWGSVTLFLDKPSGYGGKVVAIVLR